MRTLDRLSAVMRDPVNASAVRIFDGVAANVGVVPVLHIDASLGTDLDAEPDPRPIVRGHEVIAVLADKAGSWRLHNVGQHGVLVNVAHE